MWCSVVWCVRCGVVWCVWCGVCDVVCGVCEVVWCGVVRKYTRLEWNVTIMHTSLFEQLLHLCLQLGVQERLHPHSSLGHSLLRTGSGWTWATLVPFRLSFLLCGNGNGIQCSSILYKVLTSPKYNPPHMKHLCYKTTSLQRPVSEHMPYLKRPQMMMTQQQQQQQQQGEGQGEGEVDSI